MASSLPACANWRIENSLSYSGKIGHLAGRDEIPGKLAF
jgi:hypothetical protein